MASNSITNKGNQEKMYAICTDGTIIIMSKIVDEEELVILNKEADEATAGNWWWEPGDEENVKLPKSDVYKHIKSVA